MAKSAKNTITTGPAKKAPAKKGAGIGSLIPEPTDTSTRVPDPYHVGQDWQQHPVNTGGLFGDSGLHVVNGAIHSFLTSDPSTVANIQALLYQAGAFYPQNYVPTPGVVRPQDRDAFQKAVLLAAQQGVNLEQYLTGAASSAADTGAAATPVYEPQTFTINHANPIDVSDAATRGFTAALGRKPTSEETQRFLANFSGQETAAAQPEIAARTAARASYIAAQKQAAAGGSPGDLPVAQTVTSTDAPNPATAAEDFARKLAPAEAQGHDLFGYFQKALQFFSTPGGWG